MKDLKLKRKQFRCMRLVYPMAFLCLFSSPSWAIDSSAMAHGVEQSKGIVVKGTVIDEDNLPVIGANIMVKGTSLGTITDMDGNFTLTVPYEDAVLTVSFIGYTTKDVPLKGQRQVNVTLVEDVKDITRSSGDWLWFTEENDFDRFCGFCKCERAFSKSEC